MTLRFLAFALAVPIVSCSSKEETPPAPADTGTSVTGVETFTPAGCGYAVTRTKVEGLPLFDLHADASSAAPNIRHVRRGLGGDVKHGAPGYADPSTSFAVGWQTDQATKASRVRFGESPDKLDKIQDGASFFLQRTTSDEERGIRFHEVHVCGLTPGRTYHYQVGGGAAGSEVWSPVYSLTTAPAAGAEVVDIGFVGDTRDALGRSDLPIWSAISKRYKAAGTKLVLFSGDMVLVGADEDMWGKWNTAAGEASSSSFFALAPGNHENEQPRFFANALMPTSSTKNAERYSSFDFGPVHVVMIDDYQGLVAPSIDDTDYKAEVTAWLEADLGKANANRAKVPWIVTFHHHPMYSDTGRLERAEETKHNRDALLALYDKHGVDLDLAGHDHFYERFKTLKGGVEDPKGTNYVICAAAGAPNYALKMDRPLAAQVVEYDPDKGEGIYGILTASATALKVKVHKMNGMSGTSPTDDAVVDEFDIAKR